MTSINLLVIIYVTMVIFGYWRAEARRPSKKLNYYNYDDESEIFERQSDTDYQLQQNEEDPMDEVLDTSDLESGIGLHSRFGQKKKHRSQRKPAAARKFPSSWSMLVKEAREGDFDSDFKMIDEEEEQH